MRPVKLHMHIYYQAELGCCYSFGQSLLRLVLSCGFLIITICVYVFVLITFYHYCHMYCVYLYIQYTL